MSNIPDHRTPLADIISPSSSSSSSSSAARLFTVVCLVQRADFKHVVGRKDGRQYALLELEVVDESLMMKDGTKTPTVRVTLWQATAEKMHAGPQRIVPGCVVLLHNFKVKQGSPGRADAAAAAAAAASAQLQMDTSWGVVTPLTGPDDIKTLNTLTYGAPLEVSHRRIHEAAAALVRVGQANPTTVLRGLAAPAAAVASYVVGLAVPERSTLACNQRIDVDLSCQAGQVLRAATAAAAAAVAVAVAGQGGGAAAGASVPGDLTVRDSTGAEVCLRFRDGLDELFALARSLGYGRPQPNSSSSSSSGAPWRQPALGHEHVRFMALGARIHRIDNVTGAGGYHRGRCISRLAVDAKTTVWLRRPANAWRPAAAAKRPVGRLKTTAEEAAEAALCACVARLPPGHDPDHDGAGAWLPPPPPQRVSWAELHELCNCADRLGAAAGTRVVVDCALLDVVFYRGPADARNLLKYVRAPVPPPTAAPSGRKRAHDEADDGAGVDVHVEYRDVRFMLGQAPAEAAAAAVAAAAAAAAGESVGAVEEKDGSADAAADAADREEEELRRREWAKYGPQRTGSARGPGTQTQERQEALQYADSCAYSYPGGDSQLMGFAPMLTGTQLTGDGEVEDFLVCTAYDRALEGVFADVSAAAVAYCLAVRAGVSAPGLGRDRDGYDYAAAVEALGVALQVSAAARHVVEVTICVNPMVDENGAVLGGRSVLALEALRVPAAGDFDVRGV